jgi:hypothetical protein
VLQVPKHPAGTGKRKHLSVRKVQCEADTRVNVPNMPDITPDQQREIERLITGREPAARSVDQGKLGAPLSGGWAFHLNRPLIYRSLCGSGCRER